MSRFGAQAFEAVLAGAARPDVRLDRLAHRPAQLLGEQSLQVVGRGTRSQVAGHEEASGRSRAGGLQPRYRPFVITTVGTAFHGTVPGRGGAPGRAHSSYG